jgi:ABC-type uncharacterized transport system substrate-binding protein
MFFIFPPVICSQNETGRKFVKSSIFQKGMITLIKSGRPHLIPVILMMLAMFIPSSCRQETKSIVYVNSYHPGYPPSDEVYRGVREGLPAGKYDLQVFYMDSKRRPSGTFLESKADSAFQLIQRIRPGAVIVSDDNAVKYLVEPYLNDTDIPVVFCGVNWSAEQYQLDRSHITGMVEVLPLRECIMLLKEEFENPVTLTVLSENSLSERNNTLLLDTLYRNMGLEPVYMLVDTFEEWKNGFRQANETADAIYLPTNGAISGWDKQEAVRFVEEHIRKPVFTCDDFMMDYCLFGLTKVPAEQGEWASETVDRILDGVSAQDIPVTRNKETKAYLNTSLSEITCFLKYS